MASFITLLAFILDWIVGDPQRWPHPVRFIGKLINSLEKVARGLVGLTQRPLELAGIVLAVAVVGVTMGSVALLLALAAQIGLWLWVIAVLYLVYSGLCLRDLLNHKSRVEQALVGGHLEEARRRLSFMVGRDTDQLEPKDIRRALIETLAENLSDGIVAPLFYLCLGGPVLAWGYKAINTLDSMVGYKNEKYLHLGRFSAKIDDVVNYLPARLSALLLIWTARLTGLDWLRAHKLWRRDCRLHSSPNSGHPEAAMAGALGLWLGGPDTYGGVFTAKPIINPKGCEPDAASVKAATHLVVGATIIMLLLTVVVLAIFTGDWGWGR